MSELELPSVADLDLLESHPWDRQTDEPAMAYEAFRAFRDLAPSQRSNLGAVANGVDVTIAECRAWAAAWAWEERAEAWDEVCHRIEDAERLDAIRQMHAVHRRAGRAALAKAVQALNGMKAEDLTPSQAARLLELGSRLERSTLIVSVEELQGLDVEDVEEVDDPWERISRELDPDAVADA